MRQTKYSFKLYNTIQKLKLDKEEIKGVFLCLYINGCSSEDCANLFNSNIERVINILKSEMLHGYQACCQCGKLKDRKSQFKNSKDNKRSMVCINCQKENKQQYYQNNKDFFKEYYVNNRGKIDKVKKQYYLNNKETFKERFKEYYQNNKDHYKKLNKDYRKENKEKLKEQNKEYHKQFASVEQVQKLAKYEEVFENQIRCKYCGKWITPTVGQVNDRIRGTKINDRCYIYCSEQCKQECPTYRQQKYPKGFKIASSREVNPYLRQTVLERDNHTCQKCGKTQKELEVGLHCHHIIPYVNSPLEVDDPDNCITLCKDCHKLVHTLPDCRYHELKCNSD